MKLLQNWYLAQTRAKKLIYDEYQNAILQQLDSFITNFSNSNFLSRLFHPLKYQGIYIYGDVGRGKSMIMDELFNQLPEKKKVRIHFHQFMSDIHQKLANLKDHEEPLNAIGKELKHKYRIIFLDEMQVNDIATAMILKNLFYSLFANNIRIITSSNYAPDSLYLDGLMRERFLGAIELIKQKLQVLNLNSNQDYRLIHTDLNKMFIIGDDKPQSKLADIFHHFADDNPIQASGEILIQSRPISYVQKSAHIIWFKFDIICGEKRSALDYLELSKLFDYFIIEGIVPIAPQNKDTAKRLTHLVDVIYDNRKKLILSSSCGIGQIYPTGDGAIEFGRTVSRLMEMQAVEYLTQQSLESIAL